MMARIFDKTDILLPSAGADMSKWACVACDQFTSEPEYWRRAEEYVGAEKSTLHLIFPEAYLESRDQLKAAEGINERMEEYLASGFFREIKDAFIYVERTLKSGLVRRGLVGALDLECYDWSEGTHAPIRATEGTVEERLPPRVRVRMGAALELPHIMVFINDEQSTVIPSAAGGEPLYDFELMEGGGHIRGFAVTGERAERVSKAVEESCTGEIKFAMGDGNHSLATAKRCWERIKPTLSERERESHPARFALVELVNIHDEAVTFEPIHRVLFDTAPGSFLSDAAAGFPTGESGHAVTFLAGGEERTLIIPGYSIGELIGRVESFCQAYIKQHGGSVDYIHGEEETRAMSGDALRAGVLLPRMEKGEVFPSVEQTGPFPRKSFSIGHARDKRYYLECRRIK